ncbi:MAG: two component transcriptional regulator, winged helix family [Acidobacteria bacterium]|nr:two component transcriptional regulator, winged helix family [Acidobacteriota bacterium]
MSLRTSASEQAAATQVVLIADGDPAVRASFRSVFGGNAYELHESEDGAEALGKALCHKPGLIIAETHLRRIDGLALCRLLRADPATRETPIIMIASSASEIERVRDAGADHVLDRPFTPEAVMTAARQLMDRAWVGHTQPEPSPRSLEETCGRRPNQRGFGVRSVRREQTTTPPRTPPPLMCPICQASLVYQHSHTGGVNPRTPEQWDYYQCSTCGPYQYRHRTRKLKADVNGG